MMRPMTKPLDAEQVPVPSGTLAGPLQVWALLVSLIILGLGTGLQSTLLGVRAGLEGMAEESIGVIMSAYFIGYSLGSFFVPRLVREVGHIRTFAALVSLASAVVLAYALVVTPFTWTILRVLYGACYAGTVLIAESWLNSATDISRRGQVLSIYGLVLLASWMVGQSLLNVASPMGFALFALVSIFMSVAVVPITLARATYPSPVGASRMSLRRLMATSPLGVVGVFTVGVVSAAFYGMGPVYAQQLGLGTAGISAFMASGLAGALIMQWPLGALSDRIDRRKVILLAAVVAAAGAAILSLTGPQLDLRLLLPAIGLFGAFAITPYSVCVAHINDAIDSSEFVAAAGSLVLVYGAGASVGPVTASVVMGAAGPEGLFYFAAAVQGLFVLFGLYRFPQRKPIKDELKEAFMVFPRTTHAVMRLASQVDPRRNQRK